MIRFHKLILNNFMNYTSETTIPLDNQGLALIIGKTGAGKSTIHTALSWCLFGLTARGTRIDGVVNDIVNQDCYVFTEADVDNKPLTIKRYRNHSMKSNALEVVFDGTEIIGRVPDIQKDLEQNILHMTFDQFTLSTLFAQDRIRYFAAETPTNRLKMFESLLSLERFERAYRLSHDRLMKSSKAAASMEATIVTLERRIPEVELLLQETKEKNQIWDEQKDNAIKDIKHNIDQEKNALQELGQLEKPNVEIHQQSFKEREEAVYQLNEKLVKMTVEATNIEKELRARKNIDDLVGKECPTCSTPITPEKAQLVKDKEDERLNGLKQQLPSLNENIDICREKLGTAKEKKNLVLKEGEDALQSYETWKSKKSMMEFNIQKLSQDIDEKSRETNPHEEIYQKLLRQQKNVQDELDSTKKILAEENKAGEILDTTKTLFSRKGLRFYYIKQCIRNLEAETRKVLNMISAGRYDVSIQLDEDEELQLNVFINNKQKDYAQCSHGEKHCINCALVFGFNSMIKQRKLPSTNVMFLDEILDLSMDDELTESTYKFLEQLKNDVGSVFVISHKEGFKALFPKVWEVEDGIIK